jgi:hypothetical protein
VHWRVTSDPLQVCTIKSRITGIAWKLWQEADQGT